MHYLKRLNTMRGINLCASYLLAIDVYSMPKSLLQISVRWLNIAKTLFTCLESAKPVAGKNSHFMLLSPALLLCVPLAYASETWVPVRDVSLMVEEDSILDFSKFVHHPAPIEHRIVVNQQGHWVSEDAPDKRLRFLIGSLGFGVNLGSLPDHAFMDAYVKQYKMHGYNMVRLDFIEAMLMEGRKGDFDYNPEQLDRFYYLVASLRKNGIYLILNGLSNDNGGYGNVEERWIGKKGLSLGVYFEPEKQAHWKKLMATMYGSVNPYTGTSVLKDPTLVGLTLVNENNMVFVNRHVEKSKLKPYFAAWLLAKYGSQQALKAAWGKELNDDEDLVSGQINFPKQDGWVSKRMADAQLFYFETEQKTADWMTRYLRELGFAGVVSSYNFWLSPAAHASRGQLSWVDMHHYFGHPEYVSESEIRVPQQSMLKGSAWYIQELAVAKHLGKPFTVSEHGQVFWNPYRRESTLALPAYAAFQTWDGICQHSGAVDLSYAKTVGRKNTINPFSVGTDPISRATETMAALLYLRGDVAPAKRVIGAKFTPQDAFVKHTHYSNMPSDVTRLSLVTGFGLDWLEGAAKKRQYDGQVDFFQSGLRLLEGSKTSNIKEGNSLGVNLDKFVKKHFKMIAHKTSQVGLIADSLWADRVANLRAAGWLSPQNATNPAMGVYQSDTNEILLDSAQRQLQVITDKTEAVVFDQPSRIQLKNLTVLAAEKGAMVAVSSMDNQPLASSRRILLVLATDARNSDMRFADPNNVTATSLGRPPVLILANKVTLALHNTNAPQLKVFSTNLRGQRMDAINLKQTDTTIEFEVDIRKLSHGATTYFEISV